MPGINSGNVAADFAGLNFAVTFEKGLRGVRSVSITSDNRFLVISYEYGNPRIRVVDLENMEFLPFDYEDHKSSVRLTCITKDNKAFYTASWDSTSRRYELQSGKCTHVYSGFGRSPSCFLSEPEYLFTASYDHDIELGSKNACRCWDLASGKLLRIYRHTNNRVSPEAIDAVYADGILFTGSDDGYLYRWRFDQDKPDMTYFACPGTIRKLSLSRNYIAAACTDSFVRVHYRMSGECYMNFMHDERDVREVRISRNETMLWSGTDNGTVSCFNLITGELIYRIRISPSWIWSMALMNNEKVLITGNGDGTVAFLSSATGRILACLYNPNGSPDYLITCPPDKIFPSGFFYTSNKDLIKVEKEHRETKIKKELEMNDPERAAYIDKHNLRHLVIARLKNEQQYNSLTDNYMQRIMLIEKASACTPSRSLKP